MKGKIMALWAGLFFCNFYPFFITDWFFKPSFGLGVFFIVMWSLFLIPNLKEHSIFPASSFSLSCVISILYFLFRTIIYDELFSLTYIVNIIFGWISVFLMLNSFSVETISKFLFRFIFIMIVCSIVGVFLYSLGFLNVFMSQEYGTDHIYVYGSRYINNYIFFNTKVGEFSDQIFLRSAGWFEEPGSFAYVIALLMVYNLYRQYSKSREYKLIFGGLVTLSAAHIIISSVYFTLRNFTKKKIFILFFIFGLVLLLYYFIPEDGVGGYIRHVTFERFENILEGSDRSRDFDTSKQAMQEFLFTGSSVEQIIEKYPSATRETIYFHVAQFGLIGLPFYYLIVIVGLFRGRLNYRTFLAGVVLFLLFAQRPEYLFPFYIFLFYYIFYFINQEDSKK